MRAKTILLSVLLTLAMFSYSALAAEFGYCKDYRCVGGPNEGGYCNTNVDCNLPPIETKTAEQSGELAQLYADITLGIMGVAVAAIITLVGFAIYAKGAQKKAQTKKTPRLSSTPRRSKTTKTSTRKSPSRRKTSTAKKSTTKRTTSRKTGGRKTSTSKKTNSRRTASKKTSSRKTTTRKKGSSTRKKK